MGPVELHLLQSEEATLNDIVQLYKNLTGKEPTKRELEEETGYATSEITYIQSFATSPGFADIKKRMAPRLQ